MTLDGAIAWCLAIASQYEDEDGDKTAQLLQVQDAEIARLRAEVADLQAHIQTFYEGKAPAALAARDRVIEAAFRALDAARTWEFATGREPDLGGILDLYRDSEAEARRLREELNK